MQRLRQIWRQSRHTLHKQTDDPDPNDGIQTTVAQSAHARYAHSSATPVASTSAEGRGQTTPLSYFEIRALVESLEPSMPISKLRPVIERTKLPVSPGTGGGNRRTKVDILNDLRRTVGLPPLQNEPPMGEPVSWQAPASPIPIEWPVAPEAAAPESDMDGVSDVETSAGHSPFPDPVVVHQPAWTARAFLLLCSLVVVVALTAAVVSFYSLPAASALGVAAAIDGTYAHALVASTHNDAGQCAELLRLPSYTRTHPTQSFISIVAVVTYVQAILDAQLP